MARGKKRWVYVPPKPVKPKVPEATKAAVLERAQEMVETVLKPKLIKPPPKDDRFNYMVDITTKWYRSYFYVVAKYACPGPTALSPFFEAPLARMEYAGPDRYHLSYMRHTGQWWQIYTDLSLDEGLEQIESDPHFHV